LADRRVCRGRLVSAALQHTSSGAAISPRFSDKER
jgi:hypothetical protein